MREKAVAGGPADEGQAAFGVAVAEHAGAAVAAGVDPASAEAAEVLDRVLASRPVAERAALADQLERFTDARVERYWSLLGITNGWPARPPLPVAIESSPRYTSKQGDMPTPQVSAASRRPTGTAFTRVMRAISTKANARALTPRLASESASSRTVTATGGACI